MPKTLFDKIWEAHEVGRRPALHRPAPRPRGHEPAGVRRPAPRRAAGSAAPTARSRPPTTTCRPTARRSRRASRTSSRACRSRRSSATARSSAIPVYSLGSDRQGIVHVIGPELGVTQPGMTIVCGDSHTSTHGAFGALAFGIGTSEVEHVLATQCLVQHKPALDADPLRGRARLRRDRQGPDPRHDRADRRRRRDRPRRRVRRAGDPGALDGGPHDGLQHDDRGRRARRHDRARRDDLRLVHRAATPGRPAGAELERGDRALARAAAATRARASTARSTIDATAISPAGHAGARTPGMVRAVDRAVPAPEEFDSPADREATERALALHGRSSPARRSRRSRSTASSSARARTRGSATCAPPPRSSRAARSPTACNAMVVPGSQQVKAQAEAEGLDEVFRDAGFDWRVAGCSMCLGMNPDILAPGERCASTSNRNFEGRQGRGGRTHLVSPQMAAAAAIEGHFVDIRTSWTDVEPVELAMEPIETITGRSRHLDRADVDTDQIIPKQFLKRIERTGFGEFLFYDWAKEPGWDLPANPILVAGATSAAAPRASTRRGRCRTTASRRSSRRASPTSSTPTARRSGCCRWRSDEEDCHALAHAGEGEVDLRAAGGPLPARRGRSPFEIDHEIRHRLLNGLDDIALTLRTNGSHTTIARRTRPSASAERPRRRRPSRVDGTMATTSSPCPATGSARRSWPPTVELLARVGDVRVRGARLRRRLDRRARHRAHRRGARAPAAAPTRCCSPPSAGRSGTRPTRTRRAPSRACSACARGSACTRTCARSSRCRRSTTPRRCGASASRAPTCSSCAS